MEMNTVKGLKKAGVDAAEIKVGIEATQKLIKDSSIQLLLAETNLALLKKLEPHFELKQEKQKDNRPAGVG